MKRARIASDPDDPVMPAAPATTTTPERRLLLGVLRQAAHDLRGRYRVEVVRWLRSDVETPGAFA